MKNEEGTKILTPKNQICSCYRKKPRENNEGAKKLLQVKNNPVLSEIRGF